VLAASARGGDVEAMAALADRLEELGHPVRRKARQCYLALLAGLDQTRMPADYDLTFTISNPPTLAQLAVLDAPSLLALAKLYNAEDASRVAVGRAVFLAEVRTVFENNPDLLDFTIQLVDLDYHESIDYELTYGAAKGVEDVGHEPDVVLEGYRANEVRRLFDQAEYVTFHEDGSYES
jgi:hypothetical protein